VGNIDSAADRLDAEEAYYANVDDKNAEAEL
jgi:hypothetical protein